MFCSRDIVRVLLLSVFVLAGLCEVSSAEVVESVPLGYGWSLHYGRGDFDDTEWHGITKMAVHKSGSTGRDGWLTVHRWPKVSGSSSSSDLVIFGLQVKGVLQISAGSPAKVEVRIDRDEAFSVSCLGDGSDGTYAFDLTQDEVRRFLSEIESGSRIRFRIYDFESEAFVYQVDLNGSRTAIRALLYGLSSKAGEDTF